MKKISICFLSCDTIEIILVCHYNMPMVQDDTWFESSDKTKLYVWRINAPEKGGILGHCVDKNTSERVCGDIDALNHECAIDGCILSGTRGPSGFKLKAGGAFWALLAPIQGPRRGSPLARTLANGPYSRPFRPTGTGKG